jgi:Xaa-Pro aminopeptidase
MSAASPSTRDRGVRLSTELHGHAAIASDPANVRWLSGLAGEAHELYGLAPLHAVVGPQGDVTVVAPASEAAWIEETGRLAEVVTHGNFVLRGSPSPALHKAVATEQRTLAQALTVALERVGAGELVVLDDGTPPSRLAVLAPALAPRLLKPDPAPFVRARAVKDADELNRLRAVNAVAEAAIAAALEIAVAGVEERELLRVLRTTMLEAGARPLLGSIGIAERGALVDFAPRERRLARGEAIRLDVGCVLDGYHTDMARTAVLGAAPQWLSDGYAALLAGEQAALDACHPGVSGETLFDAAIAATRTGGLPTYERSHCGHGIGLNMYEWPRVAPGATDPLPAGTTICLETPLYLIGQAGVQVEDAVVLTADGCERLGVSDRALIELG